MSDQQLFVDSIGNCIAEATVFMIIWPEKKKIMWALFYKTSINEGHVHGTPLGIHSTRIKLLGPREKKKKKQKRVVLMRKFR